VRDTIARENITATDDAAEQGADLEPGEPIDTGAEAKEFAKIIRAHVLESTGGRTYAEIPSPAEGSTGSCSYQPGP
jgi:hypothetical protein